MCHGSARGRPELDLSAFGTGCVLRIGVPTNWISAFLLVSLSNQPTGLPPRENQHLTRSKAIDSQKNMLPLFGAVKQLALTAMLSRTTPGTISSQLFGLCILLLKYGWLTRPARRFGLGPLKSIPLPEWPEKSLLAFLQTGVSFVWTPP